MIVRQKRFDCGFILCIILFLFCASSTIHLNKRDSHRRIFVVEAAEESEQKGKNKKNFHSQNSKRKEEEYDKYSFTHQFQKSYSLFQYEHPPRDALQGIQRAIQSIWKGSLTGLMAFLATPIVFIHQQFPSGSRSPSSRNLQGHQLVGQLALGLALGTLFGISFPIFGVLNGLYQITSGFWRTPRAIQSKFIEGKVFTAGKWEYYSLEHDLRRIEQLEHSYALSSAESDLYYYELLGIAQNATSKQIKKAYYKKAQQLHPDKSDGDKETASIKFAELAKAYETLSNDRTRRAYNANASANSKHFSEEADNFNEPIMEFDMFVFFPIMCDLSHEAELYVGDLSMAMFFDRIMNHGQTFQSQNSKIKKNTFWDTQTQAIYNTMQQKREVKIALHLQRTIKSYVDTHSDYLEEEKRNKVKEIFLEHIHKEALLIGKQGDYGGLLLKTIGMTISMESRVFLNTFITKKPGELILDWTTKQSQRMDRNWQITKSLSKSISKGFQILGDAQEFYTKHQNSNSMKINTEDERRELAMLIIEELMQDGLPQFLDTTWKFLLKDIVKTLQQACQKLLHDVSLDQVENKTELWQHRAEALLVVGEQFTKVGSELYTKRNALTQSVSERRKQLDETIIRLEVGAAIATREAQGMKVSQEEREAIRQISIKKRKEELRKKKKKQRTIRTTR